MKHILKTATVLLLSACMLLSLLGCALLNALGITEPDFVIVVEPTKAPHTEPAVQPTQSAQPKPTDTPNPTDAPKPTDTPSPTDAPTPKPTETPSSFLFGGEKVTAGQTAVKVVGKKNAIIRISPEEMDMLIALCPNLTNLELDYCCMADYSRIGELTGLKRLQITTTTHSQDYGIPLVDIDWVASLKNLRQLSLTYNKIDDIRAISELDSLEELNLGWNALSDEDLKWLTELNLIKLYLYCNVDLRDASPLAKIESLELLHIGGNRQLYGFEALNTLPYLRELNLGYCPVKDLEWVKHFESLETLIIAYTEYIDSDAYAALAKCSSLKKVIVSKDDREIEKALRNMIRDLRPDIEIVYYEDYKG